MAAIVSTSEPRYAELRSALEEARAALTRTVASADDGRVRSSPGSLGETEHLVEDEQRGIDSALHSLRLTSLRDIEAALDRFTDGSFGRCVTCSEQIAIERLEAMPAAANCVACQGAAESGP